MGSKLTYLPIRAFTGAGERGKRFHTFLELFLHVSSFFVGFVFLSRTILEIVCIDFGARPACRCDAAPTLRVF